MLTALVREFHSRHGFAVNEALPSGGMPGFDELRRLVGRMEAESGNQLGSYAANRDMRNLRAHLILEEVAETLHAMLEGDRLALLDGLADSVYVLTGTAVAFGLPLDEALLEVHRSNMTKDRRTVRETATGLEGDVRLRDKGASYSPPRLDLVLSFADSWKGGPSC